MRYLPLALAITFALDIPASAAQAADHAAQAVGRVTDTRPAGAPVIVRHDGRRQPARYPAVIYAQDHILIAPGHSLGIVINGRQKTLAATGQQLDYRVEQPSRSVSAWGGGILDSLIDFLTRPKAPATSQVYARGEGGPPPPSAVADPLLPAGRQLLPKGTQRVAIVWKGPAAGFDTIVNGQTTDSSPSFNHSWASFPIVAPPGVPFVLKLENSKVAWQVEIADRAPLPPAMASEPVTDGDRLARAVWLLRDGPAEWRMFALSEIAAMAEANDFVAGELWQAAQDGNLDLAIPPS
jgi:hypothetical protein